jgi:SulP family sulfate permease
VQIGGPTGAFVVIVYGIVQKYGVDGLAIATFMAGALLIIMGFARFGSAIKFIPHPVITGFTSGIAIIIFSSQIKDLLGLRMGAVPAEFVAKWEAFGANLDAATPAAMGVAALTLAVVVLWPKINRRIPGPFIALIVATVAAHALSLPVETIGSRFGSLGSSLPRPHLPHLSFEHVTALVGPAFTIAMLAAIESLLSAVVADGMIGGRHRSNMELIAQGVANLASPLFGGIPATGAIARTATNIKNGGRTPVAGITHAATLLLVTLFFGKYAAAIPLATLAAILVVVAYHMSEWRTFLGELRSSRSDAAVLLTTFALTVLVDLTVAIAVGMVLAAFLFIRRMAEGTSIVAFTGLRSEDAADETLEPWRTRIPKGVVVYEIDGPLFFGAAESFRETLTQLGERPRAIVLRMRGVGMLDSTGVHALQSVIQRFQRENTAVVLAELNEQPKAMLERSGMLDAIGIDNVCDDIADAVARAGER